MEIALETVPDRFVQEHARPARAQHNGHVSGWRVNGFEIDQGRTHGFSRQFSCALVGEQFNKSEATATTRTAGLATPVLLGNHLHIESHQRPHIGCQGAIGRGNKDRVDGGRDAHDHLAHA